MKYELIMTTWGVFRVVSVDEWWRATCGCGTYRPDGLPANRGAYCGRTAGAADGGGGGMKRDAVISECGRYRYRLYREWAQTERMPVLWVMLNPSTADANIDDPTIRRCIAFSKSWGYGAMWVGNLYGFRSTDPVALTGLSEVDARGPDNWLHICEMARQSALIVCAWGAPGGSAVPEQVWSPGGTWCLGVTKQGAPRHPLYLRGDTPLQRLP